MYKQGLQAPTLPNLVISRWICSSMINFKYFLKETSFLWHLSVPSFCYWWYHLFIQLAKKQCDLFWQRLFSVTTPGKFVLPAGVHPSHFCICWGMFFLFLGTPDRRELAVSLWVFPRQDPPTSSVISTPAHRWKDFLPPRCIRKPPMKSTETQQFFTEAKSHQLENQVAQMCQQNNLVVGCFSLTERQMWGNR